MWTAQGPTVCGMYISAFSIHNQVCMKYKELQKASSCMRMKNALQEVDNREKLFKDTLGLE